jgi:hypothetical protein
MKKWKLPLILVLSSLYSHGTSSWMANPFPTGLEWSNRSLHFENFFLGILDEVTVAAADVSGVLVVGWFVEVTSFWELSLLVCWSKFVGKITLFVWTKELSSWKLIEPKQITGSWIKNCKNSMKTKTETWLEKRIRTN